MQSNIIKQFPFLESNIHDEKVNLLNGMSKSRSWKHNKILLQEISKELTGMSKELTSLTSHFRTSAWATKNRNAEIAMEEKWKSVARKVDFHCMFAYISLMVLFHVVIALVVAFGA